VQRAHLDGDLFPERHVLHELHGAFRTTTGAQMNLRTGRVVQTKYVTVMNQPYQPELGARWLY